MCDLSKKHHLKTLRNKSYITHYFYVWTGGDLSSYVAGSARVSARIDHTGVIYHYMGTVPKRSPAKCQRTVFHRPRDHWRWQTRGWTVNRNLPSRQNCHVPSNDHRDRLSRLQKSCFTRRWMDAWLHNFCISQQKDFTIVIGTLILVSGGKRREQRWGGTTAGNCTLRLCFTHLVCYCFFLMVCERKDQQPYIWLSRAT